MITPHHFKKIVTNNPKKTGTMGIAMYYLNLIEYTGNTMARI